MAPESRLFRPVVSLPSDSLVSEAARTMRMDAVGAIIAVDDEGRAVGILTDRDLALRVVGRTCDPRTTTIADVMSDDLVSATVDDDLEALVARMKRRGVRRIPLLEADRPVGMVALDDVLRVLANELHDLGAEARQRYRHAAAAVRYEHLREDTEHRLEEISHRLAFANWFVRQSFIDELDALRDRLRKSMGAR